MRKVLLSLTLLIAGAMSVWAETTTSYLVKEATTTLTDGTYVLVAMANHGTGPCYYSSTEGGNRLYRYDKNVNVQVGDYIDNAQYVWTIDETTTGGVQKITVTNVGDPTKAFPVDGGKNQNFQGSGVAELMTEKHTIDGVEYFALKLENDAIGYIHANAPGGNPNLSYWNSYDDGGTCVKFRFYPVEKLQFQTQFTTGAYYRLVCVSPKTGNDGNRLYNTLTWNGESNLVTSPMDIENDNQVFMFEDAGDGKYYLKNLVAGKYLNKINQGGYRSAVVDKADACKLDVSNHEGVVGQFKLHNSESNNGNHCLFAENNPNEEPAYACSGWNDGANSPSAWRLVSVSLETLFGAGTEASPYLINNVDDLILFRNSVNAGETKYNAEGVYVALGANIDLAGVANWEPIGSWDYTFDGNFDGKGHKIMNLKMSDNSAANGEAYLGLFGITANNVIKNFVIENVTIESAGQIVAAAIAYPYYTTVSGITVCGDIAIKGGNYTAGVLAYTRLCQNASNLAVVGNENSYIKGAQVVGGVIADIQMNKGLVANYSNFSASGVSITGTQMVGGISGIIATQTLDGASVKNVTLASGDSRVGIISGAFGGTSTISNVVVENVTGATAIVGPTYKDASPVEILEHNGVYTIKSQFISGEGTEANPYLIKSVEDLVFFRNSVNAGETKYNAPGVYVALGANIDLAGQDWSVNIGDDCNATFDGIFDGKNHKIMNLTSTETAKKADGYICTGLFGAIAGNAVVKNLTIENVTIDAQYVGNNVGAVVGFAWEASGSIENVTVTGDININASAVTGVGAILGYDYDCKSLEIKDCKVIGTEGSSIVGGKAYVGGVVGYASSKIALNGNTVENVTVTGTASVGAIAGIMLVGSSAADNTVKSVAVSATGELWANSAAVVAGTITSNGGVTISNTTVESVTINDTEFDDSEEDAYASVIVGGKLVEKPTEPIAKVEAKIGDIYYATFDAAMAAQGNDDVELLVEKDITLDDDKAYTYTKGASDVDVEYERNLIAGIWNPLYIPFEATVSAAQFEVAEFTAAEGTTITLTKLKANEGGDIELSANTAYVVRPIDGNNTLSLDAWGYIYSNEVVSPQSLGEGFSVRGNYSVLTGDKLAATDRIVSKDGKWAKLARTSTSTLKPYRLILSVPESFSAEQNAISFSMRVLDNTTGVEETIFDGQETIVIYDLMGRRVETMTEGGIYIVNGKKMIF